MQSKKGLDFQKVESKQKKGQQLGTHFYTPHANTNNF